MTPHFTQEEAVQMARKTGLGLLSVGKYDLISLIQRDIHALVNEAAERAVAEVARKESE